ncbi:MAG: tRNA (adenosine(37)-N6)-threonylcarbamoyltransferase complex ATPase subunit type 1 TsaE [Bacteroidales bacterium]|jgi:tRNA threonylcarbamoyladenosine biosynthesis protein TsaE|nr:tRNA (adenosine(37)-N6)-threonylcarbamoyltransferase complex ATPase subunit type 1 TsaE [Bacteroidales bacterium]
MDYIDCKTIDDLPAIAHALFQKYKDNRIFALRGQMGAGKTTFMQSIAKVLNSRDTVSSPTFSIVNEYVIDNNRRIYHFDFYRIKNIDEAIHIGLDEYLYSGEYCFIEWAENIEELLPPETINIYISVNDNNLMRVFSF